MSIKAGRVGVNPSQVDPVDGSILSSATSGYTKQEADNKFETKQHASDTYQEMTLALPLETLLGTKLTVEDGLSALNEIQIEQATSKQGVLSSSVLDGTDSFLLKDGNVVTLVAHGKNLTLTTDDLLCVLPEGFRPSSRVSFVGEVVNDHSLLCGYITSGGNCRVSIALEGKSFWFIVTYVI